MTDMNHIKFKKELENQMYNYINFLPHIKSEYPDYSPQQIERLTFLLLDEIQFLKLRIFQINRMNISQAYSPVNFVKDKITAKI